MPQTNCTKSTCALWGVACKTDTYAFVFGPRASHDDGRRRAGHFEGSGILELRAPSVPVGPVGRPPQRPLPRRKEAEEGRAAHVRRPGVGEERRRHDVVLGERGRDDLAPVAPRPHQQLAREHAVRDLPRLQARRPLRRDEGLEDGGHDARDRERVEALGGPRL